MKDDLQHNQNSSGLLALKISKDIKEYLKSWGRLYAWRERNHFNNDTTHRELMPTFQDVSYRPRTEQLDWISNEGKPDWLQWQLIDTSNTKVKSVNYECFHINPCTENNNGRKLEFLTCIIVITDNTDTLLPPGLQDT